MNSTPTRTRTVSLDSSRSALDFVHRLTIASNENPANLPDLLSALAAAFAAPAAGLAPLDVAAENSFVAVIRHPQSEAAAPPWREPLEVIEKVLHAPTALTVPLPTGGSCLLSVFGAPGRGGWLLWLEDDARDEWSAGEASALWLAAQTLSRRLEREQTRPGWPEQLDRLLRQQRLDAAAQLVRRLAHDFGNVLTGILGFSELALAQQGSPTSPLHTYLTEVYRGAQNGAQYTNQLRLFARRQSTANRSANLAAAFAEEEKRLRPLLGTEVRLTSEFPPGLPAAALDGEQLRHLLGIVLDNAREAISGPGLIAVSARRVEVNAAACRDLFGDLRPGSHLEILVADSGSGLTPDARRQLFSEPFFTTKQRKKGCGLAIAYGIVSAHRGGLDLLPRPSGGTLARVLLPLAPSESPAKENPSSTLSAQQKEKAAKENILVVDDDPMILQFVTTTLERAGFRVQSAGSAESALTRYTGANTDPFHLVLSDVRMPEVSGIELAKSLMVLNAGVRVLFMSGQVPADFSKQEFIPGRFDLLPKPFRPDALVRAVRAALDRVLPPWPTVAAT